MLRITMGASDRMKVVTAIAATLLAANCAAASAGCVGRDDLLTLRTAAIQQELMVAALTCHEISRYNHFVVSHQPELFASDNRLKSFFVQRSTRRSEARYHSFKTELANTASLRSARRAGFFCARADAAFDLAEQSSSLADFVATEPIAVGAAYHACRGSAMNMPVLSEPRHARRRFSAR